VRFGRPRKLTLDPSELALFPRPNTNLLQLKGWLAASCSTTKGSSQTRTRATCYYLRLFFGPHYWCSCFVWRRKFLGIPFAKKSRWLRQNSSQWADSPIRIHYRATIRPEAPKQPPPDSGKTTQFFHPIRREKQASQQWAKGYLQFLTKSDSSFRQPITRIRE
jgi:hypothetical protein